MNTEQILMQIQTRLLGIENEQREMNKTLNNHYNHLTSNYSTLVADVGWLKEFRTGGIKQEALNLQESKDDIKTQQDVDWLKRFFWIGISAVVTSLASIGVTVIHIFFQVPK
jgi:hypothetical protein